MLVFEVVVNATHQGFGAGTYILPADRCTWEYANPAYNDGNYRVAEVILYRSTDNVSFALTDTVIDSITLGTIGKSGRFVGMTV